MYREPKLPHVVGGLSFCEACHFVRPIPVIERDVSNVFYSERKVRIFYSQSDKILGVIYPK